MDGGSPAYFAKVVNQHFNHLWNDRDVTRKLDSMPRPDRQQDRECTR